MTFPWVEALRAVAALVLVYHVIEVSHWRRFSVEGPLRTFRVGWMGVDFFLVISGFVIAHSALADHGRDPHGFRRRFMRCRLARIVPLYVLTIVVFIFLSQPGVILASPSDLAAAIAYRCATTLSWLLGNWTHIDMVTFWRTPLAISFALVVAAAITFPWANALPLSPFRYLGEISHDMYLWRTMVINGLDPLPDMGGWRLPRRTLIGTIALSAISWHWREQPVLASVRSRTRVAPRADLQPLSPALAPRSSDDG